MSADTPTVVVANHNRTLSDALAEAIRQLGWSVACQVEDLTSLVRAVEKHRPDLVVTGSSLSGHPVAPSLATLRDTSAVAMISAEVDDQSIAAHLLAGAQAWFDLDNSLAEVLSGLEHVVDGWPVLAGPAAQLVLHEWRASHRTRKGALADAPGLTPREADVLAAMSRGMTTKEIANELGVAIKTVEHHKSRIFTKFGARNTAHALAVAADRGLLEG